MSAFGNGASRRRARQSRLVDENGSPSPARQRNQATDIQGATTDNTSTTTRDPNDEEVIRENREMLRLHGLRTDLTGTALADLVHVVRERQEFLPSQATFEPFYFFFYGSLQYPGTLRSVCGLPSQPSLAPASIKDWRVRICGCYPALVPEKDNEVKGVYWKCEYPIHVAHLEDYETDLYRMADCKITCEDGRVLENGRTFVYASEERFLEDGAWSLEDYVSRREENLVLKWTRS